MQDLTALVKGYGRFRDALDSREKQRFRDLVEKGQAPETMIISCCDSRVDPAAIFDADPGDLFVLRNVANLVPPYEPDSGYHGTSAALEFAVTGLRVANIVVMGHAKCGGIAAFLKGASGQGKSRGFTESWISLLNPAHASVANAGRDLSDEERQQAMEYAAIRFSLANLRTFPFVKEAVGEGRLKLRGAYFSIFDGALMAMDAKSEEFLPVVPPGAA